MIFHYGRNIYPFNIDSLKFIFNQANVGVSYFFILSGFVMIIAYDKKKVIPVIEYLKNRFARIYPVYMLAILLFLIVKLIFSSNIDTYGLLLNVFLIQTWVPGEALSFNTPAWSLSVEFFFYLIFPFLYNLIYLNKKIEKLVTPIIAIWIISQIFLHLIISSKLYPEFANENHDLIFYFPLMHINEFLIGNLAGLFFVNRIKVKAVKLDWLVVLLLAIFIFFLRYNFGMIYHNGALAIIFIPLILIISINQGLITRLFNLKLLIFLGEISYGIYILQKPIFIFVKSVFQHFRIFDKELLFCVGFILLIAVSSLSYIYIENPLRKRIKQIKL